jgi:hypothetical protein
MSPFTVIEVRVLRKSFNLKETPDSSSTLALISWNRWRCRSHPWSGCWGTGCGEKIDKLDIALFHGGVLTRYRRSYNKTYLLFVAVIVIVVVLILAFIYLNINIPASTSSTEKSDSSLITTSNGTGQSTSFTNSTSYSNTTTPNDGSVLNSGVIVALIGILSSVFIAVLGYSNIEDNKRKWNKTDDIWTSLIDSTTTIVGDFKEMQLCLQQYSELGMLRNGILNSHGIRINDDKQTSQMNSEEKKQNRENIAEKKKAIIASHGGWLMVNYPDYFKVDVELETSIKKTREFEKDIKDSSEFEIENKDGQITAKEADVRLKDTRENGNTIKTSKDGTESIKNRGETELAKNIREVCIKEMDEGKVNGTMLGLMAILDAEFLSLYSEIDRERTTLGVISIESVQMNNIIRELMDDMKIARWNLNIDAGYFVLCKPTLDDNIIKLQNICKRELEITRMGKRDKYNREIETSEQS